MCFSVFGIQYKAQEMRDIVAFYCPFLIAYSPDKYKTQKACD